MIIPIHIDAADLMEQFNISDQQVKELTDSVVKGLTLGVYAQWQKETEVLHKTRGRYLNNLKLIDTGKLEGTILLDYSKDKLISMLENGATPFDMKRYMLASPKAKYDKKGNKYITIPFRWGTPGIAGDSDVFANEMPEEIYDMIRQKPTSVAMGGGGSRSQGLSATDLAGASAGSRTPQKRAVIVDSKAQVLYQEYTHKSSMYEGMVKQKDAVTSQSRYTTFRRISENSHQDAFIHPGIQQYNLMQRALNNFDIPSEVSNLLDNELVRLGFMQR